MKRSRASEDGAARGGGRGAERGSGRRLARPLDARRLEELALAYVARFATSAGKLSAYLRRKLREHEWEGEQDGAGVAEAVVARMVSAGYVDDAAFAKARSENLQRRGLGKRRIVQALGEAGIAGETAREVLPDESAARRAALALARKRGFGPFAKTFAKTFDAGSGRDVQFDPAAARARREKQLAAMLRAGHTLDSARELVNAISVEAAEQWVAEAEGEQDPCG